MDTLKKAAIMSVRVDTSRYNEVLKRKYGDLPSRPGLKPSKSSVFKINVFKYLKLQFL